MTYAFADQHIPIRKETRLRPEFDLDIKMDRQMPQHPEAERAVLGAVLIDDTALWRVIPILTGEELDFFRDANRIIYATMLRMAKAGQRIEPLTLKDELVKHAQLEQAGGIAYVASLVDVVPDIANIETYAQIVKRMARKRAQIVAGNALIRSGFDLEDEPEDAAAAAVVALSAVATKAESQARPLIAVLDETAAAMMALKERDQSMALTSGWSFLDEHQVFAPVFALCGANSKTGKTSLMVNFAEALASRDQPCAIISLESSARALALRYLSIRTSIPHRKMRDWRWMSERNYASVEEVRRDCAKRGIYIGFGPFTAEEILLELRRLKAVYGIRAAFVDYIQNVDLRKHVENREERFHKISKMFQLTAPELDIHLMSMSQLREGAGDEGPITLNDIAYAKSIGKSARVVLFFKRDGCKVTGQLAANNEGRTNDFRAHFHEETQQFEEGANDGREFWPCVETAEGTVHRRPTIDAAQQRLL